MNNRNNVGTGFHRAFLLALFLLTGASLASGQEVSAGITGIVTDPTGSAVVAAAIEVKDLDRGVSWKTESNETGSYALPRLPPGHYSISVTTLGFRAWAQPSLVLEVNQRARVDISMVLGAVTEVVEVSAAGPVLQTEKTELGVVITGDQTVDMPLITRNFVAMTLLAPGVTTINPGAFNNAMRSQGNARPYVNGNREQANNFLLDGIDNNQVSENQTAYLPNLDAIAEVNVITNNASAEFGNFQGGVISVTMKSGANDYHGTVFEFFENEKFGANSWARNWAGNPRSVYSKNIFGGTFGGPLLKNKLFFFGNYQGIRRSVPDNVSTIDVIPSDFRQGDFSRLLPAQGIQLHDYANADADGRRAMFPNNVIPLSRIDPVAAALFADSSLYPEPTNAGLELNQSNTKTNRQINDQGDIKGDWTPVTGDLVTLRWSKGFQTQPSTNSFPLIFDGFRRSPFQAGVANWTKTISPTVINEARVGVNHITLHNGTVNDDLGNIAEQLGIADGNKRGPGLMQIQFTNGLAGNIGSSRLGTQTLFANTTYQYVNNLTVTRGRHQMKMGGQALRQHMNTFYGGNTGRTGTIRFDGNFTRDHLDSKSKGFAEADFFLGNPSRLTRGVEGTIWGHRKWIFGFYFQDDWRASDELTLNIGLRWEWHQPLYEAYDRQANFEPYTGKHLLAGKDGNSRALYNPFNKDYQPRIGVAYTPKALGGNTVFRTAYTISSFMEGTGTNLRLPLNPPFNVEFSAIYDDEIMPVSKTGEGFSAVTQNDPYNQALIRLWDKNVRPSHVQQWNFTIEQLLPLDTVLSVGYVGQKGTHLVVPMPYLQRVNEDGTPAACGCSPYLAGNPVLKNISQISGTESNGNQEYNALQASLKKRMSHSLQYQVSYTYSKGMTDAIGYYGAGGLAGTQRAYWQNLRDQRAEWGPTYFNQAHNFVANFVYGLPIGRDRLLGRNWNRTVNAIVGGWQLSGIVSLKTGFGWTVRSPDRSRSKSRGARADRLEEGMTLGGVGPNATWFQTSAYAVPQRGTFGSAGVSTVPGPGYRTLDTALEKSFEIGEGRKFQVRADMINLFNSPIFNRGQVNVNNSRFGQIRGAQGARRIQFGLRYEF